MRLGETEVAQLRSALAAHCPPECLALTSVETFDGPSPHFPGAATIFRLSGSGSLPDFPVLQARLGRLLPPVQEKQKETRIQDAAAIVAAIAARLLTRLIGVRTGYQAAATASGEAVGCFETILPGYALQALSAALAAFGAATAAVPSPLASARPHLLALADMHRDRRSPLTSLALIASARRQQIPFLQVADDPAIWQFGWGQAARRFHHSATDKDNLVAERIAQDGDISLHHLRQIGLPVPTSRLVRPGQSPDDFGDIGYPCVVRVMSGRAAVPQGVEVNDRAQRDAAIAAVHRRSTVAVVERIVPGDDHRILVVDGQVVSAVRILSPQAAGEAPQYLDVSARLNNEIAGMAVLAASSLRLRSLGLTYRTRDISAPPNQAGGAITELEAAPPIDIWERSGDVRRIGSALLGGSIGRIPVRLLIAPRASHAGLSRALAAALSGTEGLASDQSFLIGNSALAHEPCDSLACLRRLLLDPALTSATLLWTAKELKERGLPVDQLDLAGVCGAPLPSEWMELLKERSRQVRHFAKADQALVWMQKASAHVSVAARS